MLPGGDIIAGGTFTTAGGGDATHVARWDGSAWSAVDSGMDGIVNALAMTADGQFVAGGDFTTAGGKPSAHFATLTSPCPAIAAGIPSFCNGPVGPFTLVADTLPWLGGTFASTANGIASSALAFAMIGIDLPNTPLSLLFPLALPNCDLLASPDATTLLLASGGSASFQVQLPNDPVFAGAVLYHQFLQLEIGAGASVVSLSSSNGLQLTMGVF